MSTPEVSGATLGPWGVHQVPAEGEGSVQIGPLVLRFMQEAGEIRVAVLREGEGPQERHSTGADASERPAPGGRAGGAEGHGEEDLVWTRWAPADWTGEIALSPAFPDRTLVVAPEDAFWLLNGAEARIYVRVPLHVKVEALGSARGTLCTLPTVVASDTWWGTVEEGELCYWLRTHARRRVSEELYTHHMAICPLQLVNHSGDDLLVDKIALRAAYLSLFAHGDQAVWADETRVRYTGDVEGSRLEMSGKAPAEAPGARLLAPARERMARGFRARTFARLRSIHGWM